MKVCLANHWLVTYRGGERVLAEIRTLFPDADMATLLYKRGQIPDWVIGEKVHTSPLQYLPFSYRYYKALLPLHAWGFARVKAPLDTQLVISSDAALLKGMDVPPGAKHVCYCHSPARYLWELTDHYLPDAGGVSRLKRALFDRFADRLRAFDLNASAKVDEFIANSEFVAQRIRRIYNRDAHVIYPPVSVGDFDFGQASEDYYLIVSQLVPYKRVEIAVKAFNALKRRLVVIGTGTEESRLRALAGPTVEMKGHQPFSRLKFYLERCRAFIYPQIEDFGITSVEAQACGKPVIAFRAGGAIETVVEGRTGVFFDEQTPDALAQAVLEFERRENSFDLSEIRKNALRFDSSVFRAEFKKFLIEKEFATIDVFQPRA